MRARRSRVRRWTSCSTWRWAPATSCLPRSAKPWRCRTRVCCRRDLRVEGVRKLTRLLVASRNRKKLAELRRVLDGSRLSGLTLVSLDDVAPFDEAPETGATFEDNALAKARDGFAATGLPSVADDSGLEVAALNGMPGVLSARWSGVHGDDAGNTALLLAQLRDVPDGRRGAAFVSACALVSESSEVVVRGEWPGRSPRMPRGDGGFRLRPGVHSRR